MVVPIYDLLESISVIPIRYDIALVGLYSEFVSNNVMLRTDSRRSVINIFTTASRSEQDDRVPENVHRYFFLLKIVS